MDGGVTRDFLKRMAKKGLFSRFFGERGTFLGSRGQIKYHKKKFSKKYPRKKKFIFLKVSAGMLLVMSHFRTKSDKCGCSTPDRNRKLPRRKPEMLFRKSKSICHFRFRFRFRFESIKMIRDQLFHFSFL